MRKNALTLTCVLLGLAGSAQRDSSRYDIGYTTLNASFTQHITIRGEDLQKMPFVNLADAIRAWLYGKYTQPSTVAYVVDGNPVIDANIYPIYDIEEVTLINNAAAAAPYGDTQKELVLVTTKRGRGKSGFRASAQAGFLKENEYGIDTYARFYHQYYLGAYGNSDKFSYGVSADWQRDAAPEAKGSQDYVTTPHDLQRWRLNGWIEWRPDAKNTITVQASYVPQLVEEAQHSANNTYALQFTDVYRTRYLMPVASWEGRWLPGLRNKLTGGYLHPTGDLQYDQQTTYSGSTPQASMEHNTGKDDHLFVRDHLSYTAVSGQWQIRPAIDLFYDHLDERADYFSFNQGGQASSENVEEKGSLFYITPTLDLTLARALDIQGGLLMNASSKTDMGSKRFFPFVTAGLDVLHLKAAAGDRPSLKLSGSFALRPNLFINDYSIPDMSGGGGNQSLFNILHFTGGYQYYLGQGTVQPTNVQQEPACWIWEAGLAYTARNGRVMLQYNYERRNINLVASNGITYGYQPWMASLNHVDLRFKLIDGKMTSWTSGLNVTFLRLREQPTSYLQLIAGINVLPLGEPVGDAWVGGWTNRVQAGRFTMGLDVLYHLGAPKSGGLVPPNTAAIPNVYAGYRIGGARALEVFVESRGLIMNTPNDFIDPRRYYTVGANIGL